MFDDLHCNFEEDDILKILERYDQMLLGNGLGFLELYEYEYIIDHFIDRLNYKDAIKAVVHALRQHPYASALKIRYAQLLIETGKPGKALGIIRTIDDHETPRHEIFLARGIALNLTGKVNEALIEFEHAMNSCNEGKEEVAYSIAQSYTQLNMHLQAIKYLLIALRYNEDNLLVLYDLALNYEKIDRPEKSMLYYNKFLDLDPFAEHVWNNLGLLYTGMAEVANACEAFDMAIAINPHYYSAYFNKADLMLINNDLPGAVRTYQELLEWDHSNTKALCELGSCFEESGNLKDALHSYEVASAISKECSEAWYGMGVIYFGQKEYKLSVESLKKAVSIQPANSDYWLILGKAQAGSGKHNQAINAYLKASEINPFDLQLWITCAQELFAARKINDAIRLLTTHIYQCHQHDSTLNYNLAAYYFYMEDIENALRYFNKALALNYQDHQDMFRIYPETSSFSGFHRMIELRHIPGNP
jgi:tetratricopeptide (TPR) repeat protein